MTAFPGLGMVPANVKAWGGRLVAPCAVSLKRLKHLGGTRYMVAALAATTWRAPAQRSRASFRAELFVAHFGLMPNDRYRGLVARVSRKVTVCACRCMTVVCCGDEVRPGEFDDGIGVII